MGISHGCLPLCLGRKAPLERAVCERGRVRVGDTGVGAEWNRAPPPSRRGERSRGNSVQADLCSLITAGKVPGTWELGAHEPL